MLPKTLYYKTNGTGRDLYIACDSGGNFKFDEKLGSRPNTAGYRIRPQTPSSIAGKSIHYQADGTGRDSYIKVSDGGLHSFPYRGQTKFSQSLRSYEKLALSRSANDLLAWSASWKPLKSRSATRISSIKSKRCVERLTQRKPRFWE